MKEEALIAKYLEGTLSPEETEQLYAWVREAPRNEEILMGLKQTYLMMRAGSDSSLSDTAGQWQEVKSRCGVHSRRRMWGRIGVVAALSACMLLAVLLGLRIGRDRGQEAVLAMGTMSHIETAAGESVSVVVPDGSRLELCPCSSIEYDPALWERERRIALSGKALFDVAKDASRSFVVSTRDFDVQAHGTEFVVTAYPEESTSSVALRSGSVSVNIFHDNTSSLMSPNTVFEYDSESGEHTIRSSERKDEKWNMVIFDNDSLVDKADELARKYGYTFIIPESCADLTYRAAIENESLGEFLSIIVDITPRLHYSIDRNNKVVTFFLSK